MFKPMHLFFNCLKFLIIMALVSGCENDPVDQSGNFHIPGLSIENYPRVDGSTSTEPLEVIIACKLLDMEYSWIYLSFWWNYPYRVMPSVDKNTSVAKFIDARIHHSGTHSAYENLINGYSDLILVARKSSPDEQHLADSLGVVLVETPVALDAFIFLVNNHNPVASLTTEQIQDVYTGKITSWNELGGPVKEIHPYLRERNSGSQELMDELVMKGLTIINAPDMIVYGMMGLVNQIEYDVDGLGYSVNYYTEYMIRSDSIKRLEIDGVYPGYEAIKSREYKYSTEVYVVIREDLDTSLPAYKLYELLISESGQAVVGESGYIPYY